MPPVLELRFPNLDRFRSVWEHRLIHGWAFVPHVDREKHAPDTPVTVRIQVADTPAALEFDGVVRSLHVVQSDDYHMLGADVALDLPPYIRAAVEAYLERDWRLAIPVLASDFDDDERHWVPFGPSTRPVAHETRPSLHPDTEPTPDPVDTESDGFKTSLDWMYAFAPEEHTQPQLPCSAELGRALCSMPPLVPGVFEYEATVRYSQARAVADQSNDSGTMIDARTLARQLGSPPDTRARRPPSTRSRRPELPVPERVEGPDHAPGAFIFRKR